VSFPRDVAVDMAGRIYVSERGNNRVQGFVEEPVKADPPRGGVR
jgi:hypothetical protein